MNVANKIAATAAEEAYSEETIYGGLLLSLFLLFASARVFLTEEADAGEAAIMASADNAVSVADENYGGLIV